MTAIAYPAINLYTRFEEGKAVTLVIENRDLFSEIITDIYNQTNGMSGSFVLSKDNSPIEIRKNIELITQLIPFTVNQKDLLNKIYAVLRHKAYDAGMFQETAGIIAETERYLYRLTEDFDSEIILNQPDDISGILKMFDVKINDTELTLPQKLLEYMLSVNEYKGDRVFVTVNLRSYINDADAEQLYHDILLNKIKMICIESQEHKRFPCENRIIIDEDMCII